MLVVARWLGEGRLSKTHSKIALMCLIAGVLYGLAGVGVILLMMLMSFLSVGRTIPVSHGISVVESSRMGGLAIGILFCAYVIGLTFLSPYTPGVIRLERDLYLWLAILACALLGFTEDLKPDFLRPILRLVAKFVVLGSLLWASPELVPAKLGFIGVDALLQVPLLAWALTTVFSVGFINAFNMADGANGLVPGIAAVVCTIFFMEYGRPADGILMFVCTMFLIFNVISGWFFLGDTGSYGLGAVILGYGLNGVAAGHFSIWFMVALLAYPCLDFVGSVVRRVRMGQSPFEADNGHLHNHLHQRLKLALKSEVTANSFTGLVISGCTSGLVMAGYVGGWRTANSGDWVWVFVIEVAIYVIGMRLFAQRAPKPVGVM
ncbi:MAG: glycosyltransferase [Porticoccaceae bacterium]|nr:glycosyltransferase [Porticoccaceae bacterium]